MRAPDRAMCAINIKNLEGTGHILCSGDVAQPETTQRIVRETVDYE